MQVKEYPLRAYGKAELAEAYMRGRIAPDSERKWLIHEIRLYPGLMQTLETLGYNTRQKNFTRAQVAAIFEALGPP